ncbi:MAG: ABC transporter substrate-binding protein, partial [Acidimicrobiia bacterium]|nr:ABC transporter substrate-binding protein [Acidimicrobiia bacterium]
GWVEDRTVTLVVDDDEDDTNGTLYTDTVVVERWGPGPWEVGWEFPLEGVFEILAGNYVTVDDGVDIAKSLLVEEIDITDIDEDADTVAGTAPPFVRVEVNAGGEEGAAYRSVDADADGLWLAEFANAGDEVHEQDLFDIAADTGGAAQVFDEDGDSSHRGWYVEPPPNFFVRADGDELWGGDWFGGPEVTITVDDDDDPASVLFETSAAVEDGWFNVFVGDEFDIVPGHYVVVTDGETTKSHWVTPLAVTEVDVDGDVVHGTAEPGTEVFVASSLPVAIWEHLTFQFGPDNRNAGSLNDYLTFRQAVAHAVDRDLLVAEIPGAGYAIDSYVDAYIPELSQHAWSQYPYDPAAAAALIDVLCSDLARDCAAEPPVAILSTTADFEDREILADLLVPMLGAAGIELELELEPPEVFFGETLDVGTFDIGEWAWVGGDYLPWLSDFHWWVDPQERFDVNLYNWGTSDSSQINAATARMDELVGLMEATDDPTLLEAYIAEAEQILADEVVFIPLYVRAERWEEEGPHRIVETGQDGAWTADFSVPWEDQGVLDIVFGTGGFAEQSDGDGDATHAGWRAVAPSATVEGHVYLDGAPLPEVEVFMAPDQVFTCTDADGYFVFDGVSPVEDALVATGPAYSDAGCGNTSFVDPDGMPLMVSGQGDVFLVDGYEYLEFNVEYAAAIQFIRVEDISGGAPSPVDDIPIRAFDRNDEEFVEVFGHDPDPADYAAILESEMGEVTWIDWTGAALDHEPGLAEMRYPYITDVLVLAQLDEVQGTQSNADEFAENNDGIVEGPEIVFQIGEAGPVVTVDEIVMYEGNRSSRVMVTFRLSEPVDGPVVVDWTTADGTAIAGEDYVAASGTITFRPGRTEVVKKVKILGDTILEDDESFEIVLLDVDGAGAGDPATITLLNDDAPLPELSVEDAATSEGDRRATSVGVTFVLSEPAAGRVSFTITTNPGTALPGEDYVDVTRTVRIGAGMTSATAYMRVVGDTIVEADELFTVEVSNVVGATVVDPAGDVLIINDD